MGEVKSVSTQRAKYITPREGTLRMGIFFDGTGNDPTDAQSYSNIRKLFLVYPNNYDPDIGGQKEEDKKSTNYPKVQSAYIRGVGSKNAKSEEDSMFGGGFGSGAKPRLEGMLFYIQSMIEIYKEKNNGLLPEYLELDIFGFSRGAAMARHFVNLLKQDGGSFYKIKFKYEASNLKIRTLNVFDTVGSIGIAGKDFDPGLTYHIKQDYISDAITHFIADDEYRYNFDGQFISTNDTDYPKDKREGKLHEYVLLGAHSDIGGGYKKEAHQVTNNELPKVYLNKMYKRCIDVGVPLLGKPMSIEWIVPDELNDYVNNFEKLYNEKTNLKIAHKKLREWQAYIDDKFMKADKKTNQKRQAEIDDAKRFYRKLNDEDVYTKVELDIVKIFNNDWGKYQEFKQNSNAFHDKYVHISHTDIPTQFEEIGMASEEVGDKLHRTYFTPEYEDMRALTNSSKEKLDNSNYNLGVVVATMNKSFDTLKAKKFEDF